MNLRLALTAIAMIVITLITAHTFAGMILNAAHAAPRTEYMPCATDTNDQTNCIWDAKHEGNGMGHSFFVRKDGTILYLDHHIAHALLHP